MTKINQFKKLGNTLIKQGRWFLVRAFKVRPESISKQYLKNLIESQISISKDKVWNADKTYFYVDLETIKDILKYDLVDERKYLSEKYDCDDFAEDINTKFRSIYGINTVGVARYIEVVDTGTGEHLFWHRANVFVAKENGQLKVYYLEPQNDFMKEIDSKEITGIKGFENKKIILDTIDF